MTKMDWDRARRQEGARPEAEWWWTVLPHASKCSECMEPVPAKRKAAYNHDERRAVCEVCVDALGLRPKASKRFLAAEAGTQPPPLRRGNFRRRRGRRT
jgi:hypothetical protein